MGLLPEPSSTEAWGWKMLMIINSAHQNYTSSAACRGKLNCNYAHVRSIQLSLRELYTNSGSGMNKLQATSPPSMALLYTPNAASVPTP